MPIPVFAEAPVTGADKSSVFFPADVAQVREALFSNVGAGGLDSFVGSPIVEDDNSAVGGPVSGQAVETKPQFLGRAISRDSIVTE